MNDEINTYSFLSWLRQGITTKIDEKEEGGESNSEVSLRAKVDLDLELTAKGMIPSLHIPFPAKPKEVSLHDISLYGPGDVIGIQNKAVIRTEPRDRTANFEANYLPYVDFYDEDFPWRFSPVKVDGERLTPWIALIVLKAEEFDEGTDMHGRPLHYIKVKNTAASLPPAAETWAWAHVHVNEKFAEDVVTTFSEAAKTTLKEVQAADPDRAYARLLCPRRLEPNTAYHAFVIPTFESGRLAGLGYDPEHELGNIDNAYKLPAWGKEADNYPEASAFPYYYRWRFQTASLGDFEYLVRLLEPRPMPNEVGRRDMDVSEPGYGLSGIQIEVPVPTEGDPLVTKEVTKVEVLRLGGALQTPYNTLPAEEKEIADAYDQWAQPYPHPFQEELTKFLNLGGAYRSSEVATANATLAPEVLLASLAAEDKDNQDPLITPPIYGQWHAGVERLSDQIGSLKHQAPVTAVAAGALFLATGDTKGQLKIWDPRTGRELYTRKKPKDYEGNPGKVTAIAIVPGSKGVLFVAGYETGVAAMWKFSIKDLPGSHEPTLDDGPFWNVFGRKEEIAGISFSTLKPLVMTTGTAGSVRFWKIETSGFLNIDSPVKAAPQDSWPSNKYQLMAWSPLGTHVAYGTKEGKIELINLHNNEHVTVNCDSREIRQLAFMLSGVVFYTVGADGLFQLWNLRGSCLSSRKISQDHALRTATVLPGGGYVLTVQEADATAYLWRIAATNWIQELNLDPRYRVAAGYGADVIRRNQEEYMEAAWKQVGDVLAANRLLRRGRLARQTSRVWFRRVAESDDRKLLQLTAPVHQRVVLRQSDIEGLSATERTNLRSALQNSYLPPSLISTAGRRILRPRGRLMRLAGIKAADIMDVSYGKLPAKKDKPKLTGALLLPMEEGYESPRKASFDVTLVANRIRQTIHPERTIPVRINSRINRPADEYPPGEDALDDIMTYPEIDLPMYEPLTGASPDRFLPNLHLIPNNTVSLLETNQPFIESYMVGLNHEFARELLWREFPTDQRGSYFRQFWDVSTATLTESQLQKFAEKHGEDLSTMDESEKAAFQEECLKDIPEIHRWSLLSHLGEHDHRETGKTNEKELVLVIRGELLRRYPNAVVYAHKAEWDGGKRAPTPISEEGDGTSEEAIGDTILLPLYEAKIDPDINLFGFDMTVDVAKGSTVEEHDQAGWFFVIEERPGEPRFGLDIGAKTTAPDQLENWNELHWGIAPMIEQFLKADADAPTTTSTEDGEVKWETDKVNAAHLAYILYQVPVRVAVHASEMLPEQPNHNAKEK